MICNPDSSYKAPLIKLLSVFKDHIVVVLAADPSNMLPHWCLLNLSGLTAAQTVSTLLIPYAFLLVAI